MYILHFTNSYTINEHATEGMLILQENLRLYSTRQMSKLLGLQTHGKRVE